MIQRQTALVCEGCICLRAGRWFVEFPSKAFPHNQPWWVLLGRDHSRGVSDPIPYLTLYFNGLTKQKGREKDCINMHFFLPCTGCFLYQVCGKELLTWCGHMTGVCAWCTPQWPLLLLFPRPCHCPQSTQAARMGRCWCGNRVTNSTCSHSNCFSISLCQLTWEAVN